jgi:hypothetical protein
VPGGHVEYQFALGVSHTTFDQPGFRPSLTDSELVLPWSITWGVTDRLQWKLPTLAMAYRGGEHGEVEWMPWGGLLGWSIGYSSIEGTMFGGWLGLGFDMRIWLSPRSSLDFGIGLTTPFSTHRHAVACEDAVCEKEPGKQPAFGLVRNRMVIGYSRTIADAVTLGLAAGLSHNVLLDRGSPEVSFGSVLMRGMRHAPLVRVHLSDAVSIDGYASLGYSFGQKTRSESYLLGTTSIF